MKQTHPLESLLRPAVEFNTTWVCLGCAVLCLYAPWSIALAPSVGWGMAAAFLALGGWRAHQGWTVLRYRRNMRRLPRFALRSDQIPVSSRSLWLGKGFKWEACHTQRLYDSQQPEAEAYIQPPRRYRWARAIERRLEGVRSLYFVVRLLSADTALNPVRPLPQWAACRPCMPWSGRKVPCGCRWASASATPWSKARRASARRVKPR
ncbi:hypothetical protein A8U91_03962 [Halomonas elongata]|uniref:Conjugative coupling factor TraD, PFGI-1 class n=1 Tax=Halomonas elongata TaxID=2746 RepID=A0A1B8NY23_HALEL|nr:hypothetical protein A8U91_03962 [Halomonas elongata]